MILSVTALKLLVLASVADAFLPSHQNHRQIVSTSQIFSDTSVSEASTESSQSSVKSLGLLTFDLDDTLYPIAQIVQDANDAFVKAMERYGFEGVDAFDIVKTGKEVREELSAVDPEKAAGL